MPRYLFVNFSTISTENRSRLDWGHEVSFSCQGVDYRIDLRPTNADKLESAFAPHIINRWMCHKDF